MTAWLGFLWLFVPGFTACAEFGSYAFVHPVLRQLDRENHVIAEKGLVRTFGRIMPILMTASLVLLISGAIDLPGAPMLPILAAVLWGIALVTTIAVNVPINFRTGAWTDEESTASTWSAMRRLWEIFQGVRSWLFLISFGLICAYTAMTWSP